MDGQLTLGFATGIRRRSKETLMHNFMLRIKWEMEARKLKLNKKALCLIKHVTPSVSNFPTMVPHEASSKLRKKNNLDSRGDDLS